MSLGVQAVIRERRLACVAARVRDGALGPAAEAQLQHAGLVAERTLPVCAGAVREAACGALEPADARPRSGVLLIIPHAIY
jgi:hypothetical protein